MAARAVDGSSYEIVPAGSGTVVVGEGRFGYRGGRGGWRRDGAVPLWLPRPLVLVQVNRRLAWWAHEQWVGDWS